MMLYHGANIDIQSIDLASCRPYKDFGRGFYTTDILEQAHKMAKRVARIYGGNPVVNTYEIADNFPLCQEPAPRVGDAQPVLVEHEIKRLQRLCRISDVPVSPF